MCPLGYHRACGWFQALCFCESSKERSHFCTEDNIKQKELQAQDGLQAQAGSATVDSVTE